MLVDLANGLRQQLDQIIRLELAKEQAQNITATVNVLQELCTKVTHLKHFCQLLEGRLAEQLLPIVAQFQALADDIEASRQKFVAQPPQFRQVENLNKLRPRLQNLEKEAQDVWRKYATARISSALELWQLIRLLPEVQPHATELESSIAKLNRSAGITTPTNSRDLDDFDNTLTTLTRALSNVTGLDAEIKTFLAKVSNKTATVADLTSTVLEWLQKGNRAQSFQISFVSNQPTYGRANVQ